MLFLSCPIPPLGVVVSVLVDQRNLLTFVEVGGGDGQFVFVHRTQVDLAASQARELRPLVGDTVHHLLVHELHSLQGGTLINKSYYESF